jgi:outer membrane receptor protein involved in Fe transport
VGFYAQDSWKVTRKLTLDLGLRYDYSTYYTEQYDHDSFGECATGRYLVQLNAVDGQ